MITESRKTASEQEEASSSRRRPAGAAVTLTARGGIALVFGLSLLGALIDFSFVPGLAFVVACALGAYATKPSDLPSFVAAPPVAFFAAAVLSGIFHELDSGAFFQAFFLGLGLKMAGGALWLLAGTLVALVIAWRRGLLESWRELSAKAEGFKLTQERYVEEDPVRWDD